MAASLARTLYLALQIGCPALAAPIFAFMLAGAGHGWTSPFFASLITLLTGPLAGLAFVGRRTAWGRGLALVLLAVELGADVALFLMTRAEGVRYFFKVWEKSPDGVVLWAAAWLYPQILLLVALLLGWLSPAKEIPQA